MCQTASVGYCSLGEGTSTVLQYILSISYLFMWWSRHGPHWLRDTTCITIQLQHYLWSAVLARVNQSTHQFGPDWNVSTTFGWIVLKCSSDMFPSEWGETTLLLLWHRTVGSKYNWEALRRTSAHLWCIMCPVPLYFMPFSLCKVISSAIFSKLVTNVYKAPNHRWGLEHRLQTTFVFLPTLHCQYHSPFFPQCTSLQTRGEQSTVFWLLTMASEVEVLTLIQALATPVHVESHGLVKPTEPHQQKAKKWFRCPRLDTLSLLALNPVHANHRQEEWQETKAKNNWKCL